MDKFSELVAKGVAAFNYTPIVNSNSSLCPMCREYNNIFSMATDTHMACLDGCIDDVKVITGHIIKNTRMFDQFIWSHMFAGVNFDHSGAMSFASWMDKHGYTGHYDVINGDNVYILTKRTLDADAEQHDTEMHECVGACSKEMLSYHHLNGGIIPINSRYLSKNLNIKDLYECANENIYVTAQQLNKSKDVLGDNWVVACLSDGMHLTCSVNGQTVLI